MSRRGGHRLGERLRSLYLWHRWIGGLAAPLLVLLVLSGIGLNHVEGLRLEHRYLTSPYLLARYGIRAEGPVLGLHTEAGWISAHRGRLYLDDRRVAEFDDELRSAAAGPMIAVLGRNRWMLLMRDGTPVEQQAIDRLPAAARAFAFIDEALYLYGESGRWQSPDLCLNWRAAGPAPPAAAGAAELQPLPEALAEAIRADSIRERISLARLLGDLHSGRLFGGIGVVLVDALGVLLLLLATSGPFLWWRQRRRRRRSAR